jgi:hypothetical protein
MPAMAISGPAIDHVVVLLIGLPPTNPIPCRVNSTPARVTRIPTATSKTLLTRPQYPDEFGAT